MEPQIPEGKEPQKKTGKKPLDTPPPAPAVVASSNKPLEDPTPPHTSTSLAEQPADHGNAGEQRKEGGGEGVEQKGPKIQASGTTSVGPSSATAVAAAAGAATDLQKKLRRAERFGMPVLLTEEEKRNSRAERFGTGSTLHGIQNAGQLEEQKRKARVEKFGLKVHAPVDEEAKKKARLERFAPDSKTGTTEEEKRQARAIRFSQTSGTSQAHGKANSELMASVANTR
ncbi:protein MODIFIER OF SNC1 11-like isoform X2 [Phoenix dactylifera]|uniref:Protein MODIFIER OF SNC1 11-like isoform X2 n=1 Tax=Phoenix dactylifera TaxID=42345 RepID=A0A8B7C0E8_PHODC|nr:protein MODIFIER OF SNC1 11-like isoform X2 [Phoenix dactylifera]